MIKALLCDFDGTLANTLWLYPKAYRKALERFGFDRSNKWIYDHCFNRKEEMICEELGILKHVEEFRRIYFSAANDFYRQAKLFPNVLETLKLANMKQIKLAVVSFAGNWYLSKMLPALKIDSFFDAIIGFEDVENPKPAPDAVLKACKAFGVYPSESLVIGDAKSDILMGKNAGARTMLFFPKEHEDVYDLEVLKQTSPDYIVDFLNIY